jgi:hypothetical protein
VEEEEVDYDAVGGGEVKEEVGKKEKKEKKKKVRTFHFNLTFYDIDFCCPYQINACHWIFLPKHFNKTNKSSQYIQQIQ